MQVQKGIHSHQLWLFCCSSLSLSLPYWGFVVMNWTELLSVVSIPPSEMVLVCHSQITSSVFALRDASTLWIRSNLLNLCPVTSEWGWSGGEEGLIIRMNEMTQGVNRYESTSTRISISLFFLWMKGLPSFVHRSPFQCFAWLTWLRGLTSSFSLSLSG